MILKQFNAGILGANNYLLIDEDKRIAILIDCSEMTGFVEQELSKYGVELKYILLTHGHFDHVMGINDTKKVHPDVKVMAHLGDKNLIEGIEEFMQQFGVGTAEVPQIDEYIQEGEIFEGIKVIHTPGHTQGSVCYLIGDNLFSGDTIFLESVGRTDLEGGSFSQIKSNIENKIFTLDENIKIFPGHGNSTTVKHEKEHNKFL